MHIFYSYLLLVVSSHADGFIKAVDSSLCGLSRVTRALFMDRDVAADTRKHNLLIALHISSRFVTFLEVQMSHVLSCAGLRSCFDITFTRWDPHARQWSFVASMATPRSTVGVAVLNGK